jgi:hypothetical protein
LYKKVSWWAEVFLSADLVDLNQLIEKLQRTKKLLGVKNFPLQNG